MPERKRAATDEGRRGNRGAARCTGGGGAAGSRLRRAPRVDLSGRGAHAAATVAPRAVTRARGGGFGRVDAHIAPRPTGEQAVKQIGLLHRASREVYGHGEAALLRAGEWL
eukprot:scaffold14396_cov88-Isochrysis_galbana.AAC.2